MISNGRKSRPTQLGGQSEGKVGTGVTVDVGVGVETSANAGVV